ncbi:chromosome partitioning protein ParA [Halorubrum sp. E3]|uniref:ParA family protein n=1 Tax=Halorubrum ezzemoulense TaxID=337243 RepID=UPI000BC7E520|nr:ParA family protein [Halorubrum ezzemoulense]MDB2239570.1 ParA family protein [Halorubrum ezzemoulense]OYR82221.1 chromosome partitioning protein ParA [Halorubrum distributum]OYR83737.1 chromosome partitioning protein ParA [Halorubrum sp. E3]
MTDTIRLAAFIDKGGTGKTTATAHLGVALAREGLDVLLIDLAGKQGDLAKTFGVWGEYRELIDAGDAWPNVTTVFQDEWAAIAEKLGEAAVDDLVVETGEGVDLIPAHPGLDSLDADLGNIDDAAERYSRLETFLDEYIDPRGYDAVLLDLPGLTNNVSYSGLWAAKHVLAPVEMGPFEAEQADQLREDLTQMVDAFDVEVNLAMVLPNKVDTRTKLAEEYLEAFRAEYPNAIAPEYVPYSQDIRNAVEGGQTAFALEEPSTTAEHAREAFEADARALIDRLGGV